MLVERRVGEQHLGYAGDFCRLLGHRTAAGSGDQHDRLAKRLRTGNRVQGRRLETVIVVFGKDENAHQMTFASLRSFWTSSTTLATLTPPLRLGGSSTFSVFSRGATSMPAAAALIVSIGFFFAFMMFGRLA